MAIYMDMGDFPGEAAVGDDTLDLMLETEAQTIEYGKDGKKSGNVEYVWEVEEGVMSVGGPFFDLTGDGRRDTTTSTDDVIVDGNIITAEDWSGF